VKDYDHNDIAERHKSMSIWHRDGAERSGVIVCAFNALEKLKVDQEINVYAPVLLARSRRQQFINNPVSNIYSHVRWVCI